MRTRSIGSLTVSVVGLGCNNFGRRLDLDETKSVVDAALSAGVTFLDTADVYGGSDSEAFLGRVLAGRREEVVLATKFGAPSADNALSGARGEAVDAGLVKEIGCSNMSAEQLAEAEAAAEEHGTPRFVSVQNEYSLLRREAEAAVLPACERLDIAFLPYFPLLSGILTGKYRKGRPLSNGKY